jgi:hypothetical protein
VLVVPSFDDLRTWHGTVFVRKGYYQGAVFKFIVKLPLEYNDHGIYPRIFLLNDVFNPFVKATKTPLPSTNGINNTKQQQPHNLSDHEASSNSSGGGGGGGGSRSESYHEHPEDASEQQLSQLSCYELDLKYAYPTWDSTAHFMVGAITFLKKIFYLKDEDLTAYSSPANPEAKRVFLNDKVHIN